MGKRKVTCGKCGKKFPAGFGHNRRTCGEPVSVPKRARVSDPTLSVPSPKESDVGVSVVKVRSLLYKNPSSYAGSGAVLSSDAHDSDATGSVAVPSSPDGEGGTPAGRDSLGGKDLTGEVDQVWVEDGVVLVERSDDPECAYELTLEERTKYNRVMWEGNTYWVDGDGLVHRENGPAVGHVGGGAEWWEHGCRHRTDGPAVLGYVPGFTHGVEEFWYVKGKVSRFPESCEEALRDELTDEQFYELCSHDDYVVRHIAAANPNCPEEWRTLAQLKDH